MDRKKGCPGQAAPQHTSFASAETKCSSTSRQCIGRSKRLDVDMPVSTIFFAHPKLKAFTTTGRCSTLPSHLAGNTCARKTLFRERVRCNPTGEPNSRSISAPASRTVGVFERRVAIHTCNTVWVQSRCFPTAIVCARNCRTSASCC